MLCRVSHSQRNDIDACTQDNGELHICQDIIREAGIELEFESLLRTRTERQ